MWRRASAREVYCSGGACPARCSLEETILALERTLALIKPDAVSRGLAGEILSRIHKAGFSILACKTLRLTKSEAEGFYAVHRGRPFFNDLTAFMSSGKIFALVLEAENAIAKWRDVIDRKSVV